MKPVTNIQLASFQKVRGKVTPYSVLDAGPIEVHDFGDLLKKNAEVVSRNTRYSIFYRGQTRQYYDRNGKVSILPSIYRGVTLKDEAALEKRFEILDDSVKLLRGKLTGNFSRGLDPKFLRTVNCWAIIQHYELFGTPLIDVTQSLRVACAFALQEAHVSEREGPVIYDIALPFAAGPLTLDDNEELYLMKLDALMPPDALRPFIQESYLVGNELIRKSGEDIARSDLKRRVIASFRLCGNKEKWRNEIGFKADSLMVGGDKYSELRSMIYGDDVKPVPSGVETEDVVKNLTYTLLEFAKLMNEIR